jgi:outer membrane receptor for Fe3+-dicitrate
MTYTYTQASSQAGDFAGKDLPLYRATRPLSARYSVDRWTFNADLNAQSKQRSPGSGTQYVTQEDASGRLGDMPGFATVNLRTGYQMGKEAEQSAPGRGGQEPVRPPLLPALHRQQRWQVRGHAARCTCRPPCRSKPGPLQA